MRRRAYLFRQLVWLIAAVTVPMLALLAYNIHQQAGQTRRAAYQAVENHALGIAHDIELLLGDTENYLDFLAGRPLIKALDDRHCDPLLTGVVQRRRHFANVFVTDLLGKPVCFAEAGPGERPHTVASYAWFQQAMGHDGISLSKPFLAPVVQRYVTAMSLPLREEAGRRIGTVTVLLDLENMQRGWTRFVLPPNSRLTIFDSAGTILVTRPDFATMVGRDVGGIIDNAVKENPGGVGVAPGIDGVERAFAIKPISPGTWRAIASIPADHVFAESRAQLERSMVVAAVLVAAVLALALWIARRLAAPLLQIGKAARAVANGDLAVRAPESLPGEFHHVAREFNAMLDAGQTAQIRERRHVDFYKALSRTNGAIVRMTDPQALYQEICTICVDHGHASIAYVSLVDGDRIRPVARAGPADAFVCRFADPAARPDAGEGGGLTADALRTGERQVANDCLADARTLPWREAAASIGTKAVAAFPFRRAGRTIGALSLHMTVEGFFDARLVDLIEEMASDISFALDNFDREHARSTAEREAEANYRRFRMLFQAAPVSMSIVRMSDQRLLDVNETFGAFTGQPPSALIGRRAFEEGLWPGELERRAFLQELRARNCVRNFAMSAMHVSGESRDYLLQADIIEIDGEECVLAIASDVTDLRQAEQARLAQAAAETASRAKTEFLSRMSHELRTPLNAVLGFSQLLQSDVQAPLAPNQYAQVDYIRKAGWHLLTLINDVLDVSKIEAGKVSVEERGVDLLELLDDAVLISEAAAAQQDIVIVASYRGGERVSVWADPGRLRQAMINLLSNAIKYNRRGGSVAVRVEVQGARAWIEVEDSGLGMSAEQLQHLYEPFNRLGRERNGIEGTGLGLALTRQLMHLMHGEIEVRSEVGVGTCVRVAIPSHEVAAPAAGPTKLLPPSAQLSLGDALPAGVVLYIEDNPVNLLLIEQLLLRWPDVVLVQAESGREGIAKAGTAQPDLVLLDMRLPDMDGLAVLETLQRDPLTRGLSVVALSASAMPEEVAAARAAGAIDYWTKPLDFDYFLAEMRRLLGRRT
ncbi:MAG: ATP-binding protein [Burkholderiaceae bacterium]